MVKLTIADIIFANMHTLKGYIEKSQDEKDNFLLWKAYSEYENALTCLANVKVNISKTSNGEVVEAVCADY